MAPHAAQHTVFAFDGNGVQELTKDDALVRESPHLLRVGGAVGGLSAVDHRDLGAEPNGGARTVHRHVAGADDADAAADLDVVAAAGAAQEAQAVPHTLGAFACQPELLAAGRARREDNGDEAPSTKIRHLEIDAAALSVAENDAGVFEGREVALDRRIGSPVDRNGRRDHAAGLVIGLEDGDVDPGPPQLPRRREAARSAADHGNSALRRRRNASLSAAAPTHAPWRIA